MSSPFQALQVLRTEKAAMCPSCKGAAFAFVRLSGGGMVCVPCGEKPAPIATREDLHHPTRSMETIFRHGNPVICTSCEKERTVFSRLSGLCIACSNGGAHASR
jgi:hypothetical protein